MIFTLNPTLLTELVSGTRLIYSTLLTFAAALHVETLTLMPAHGSYESADSWPTLALLLSLDDAQVK